MSQLLTDLLADINGDSLVMLLGAGLSMAPPSAVPSAYALRAAGLREYHRRVGKELPPEITVDLEKMADWFYAKAQLESQFQIDQLVEWQPLRGAQPRSHRGC